MDPSVPRKIEYAFYALVSAIYFAQMFYHAYDASNDFTRFLDQRGRQLQAGWLPWTDRKIDLMMDPQYKSFRDALVTIFIVAVVFSSGWRLLTAAMANASARVLPVNWRMGWYCIFSVVFIVILHGSGALHLLWILSINYVLSRACTMQGRYGSAAVAFSWLFACTMVLASEYYNGFQAVFTSSRAYFNTRILVANQTRVAAHTVDVMLRNFFNFCVVHQSNVMTPWKLRFPLVMLKMISFNMDKFWATREGTQSHAERDAAKEASVKLNSVGPSERSMAKNIHNQQHYSITWYVAYMLYPPLYIAGPTVTFNSFVASIRGQGVLLTGYEKAVVVARALFCFLVFEVFIHYFYIGSIAKSGFYKTFLGDPLKCVQFSLMAVLYIYLKFLVIWRVFRAWAIVDGIYPPENMPQCIICTTSIADFWKGWHSSFNKWLVRYMYIPLGGNMKHLQSQPILLIGRKLVNVALVFTFVAVWHDSNLNLLAWGWVLIVCMIPEMVAGSVIMMPRFKPFREGPYYRHAQAAGSVFAIYALILANVIGFSTGVEGGQSIYSTLSDGIGGIGFGALFYYCMSHFNHLIRQKQRAAAKVAGTAAVMPWRLPQT